MSSPDPKLNINYVAQYYEVTIVWQFWPILWFKSAQICNWSWRCCVLCTFLYHMHKKKTSKEECTSTSASLD